MPYCLLRTCLLGQNIDRVIYFRKVARFPEVDFDNLVGQFLYSGTPALGGFYMAFDECF